MQVYFIRHGETEGNRENRIQGSDDILSEKGKDQAKVVAERLKEIGSDIIYSSPYPRALETAKTISRILNIDIIENELFQERKSPTSLHGLSRDDAKVLEINNLRREQRKLDANWAYEDEEGFEDLKTRSINALKFLEQQENKNIIVLTHGNILIFFLCSMIFGNDYDRKTYKKLAKTFKVNNTGISVCKFTPPLSVDLENKEGKWTVKSWNDMAHIKDIN